MQERLNGLAAVLLDGDAADWSGIDQFKFGELVNCLGAVDGGLMIRSSERGASRSVGVFVGGQSQWTTCRDQRELIAMLEAIQTTLEGLVGAQRAGEPVSTPSKRAKRS